MTLEEMRDEFEASLARRVKLPQGAAVFKRMRKGEQAYESLGSDITAGEITVGWWAWQDSRAAVLIALPEAAPLGDCSPPGLVYEEVVEAIEAAGVKVAP